ncbi:uncharacterized protein METZ01_LOCUS471895, partial [marine metagenome]
MIQTTFFSTMHHFPSRYRVGLGANKE